jgi:hypothetical protein
MRLNYIASYKRANGTIYVLSLPSLVFRCRKTKQQGGGQNAPLYRGLYIEGCGLCIGMNLVLLGVLLPTHSQGHHRTLAANSARYLFLRAWFLRP